MTKGEIKKLKRGDYVIERNWGGLGYKLHEIVDKYRRGKIKVLTKMLATADHYLETTTPGTLKYYDPIRKINYNMIRLKLKLGGTLTFKDLEYLYER